MRERAGLFAAMSEALARILVNKQRIDAGELGLSEEELVAADPALGFYLRRLLDPAQPLERWVPPGAVRSDWVGVGTRMGEYRLERHVASGAHGEVWEARREGDEARVAVKVLRRELCDRTATRERFRREATILEQADHPNLVRFLGHGLTEDRPWIAMEYVEGPTLQEVLQGQAVPRTREECEVLVRIVLDLAQALQHAHSLGAVHRDVKPANIKLTADGTARLLDFGVVHAADLGPTLTATDGVVGTPFYMAPETVLQQRPTPASDLWSLGVVLFEGLCHRLPFEAASYSGYMELLRAEPRARVRRENPLIDRDLALLVETTLRHRVADRYVDMEALSDDLRRWLEGRPVQATEPGQLWSARRWVQRNPVPTALFVMVLVAATAVGAAMRSGNQAVKALAREDRALQTLSREQAQRTFDSAELLARDGRWTQAEEAYGQAETLGHDSVAVELGRVAIGDALRRDEEVDRRLSRLRERDDLRHHADLVQLLWLDPSRTQRLGRPTEEQVQWREGLTDLVDAPGLAEEWRLYAQACLAPDIATASKRVEELIEYDDRHRMGQELRLSLSLLSGGPERAREVVLKFRTLWPEDPGGVLFDALTARLKGDQESFERVVARLPDQEAGLNWDGLVRVRETFQEQASKLVGDMERDFLAPGRDPQMNLLASGKILGSAVQWQLQAQAFSSRLRVAPCMSMMAKTAGFSSVFALLGSVEQQIAGMSNLWSTTGMSTFLGLRGVLRIFEGQINDGEEDLERYFAAPEDWMGIEREMRRMRRICLIAQAVQPRGIDHQLQVTEILRGMVSFDLGGSAAPSRQDLQVLMKSSTVVKDSTMTLACVGRLLDHPDVTPEDLLFSCQCLCTVNRHGLALLLAQEAVEGLPGETRYVEWAKMLEDGTLPPLR